ncbi:MAG: sigma 54-interacting transcriptional regulator [Firmicutes bacterium]|jgi:transcriptional regulator with PAS, ATPase and Fis domain|nr:sigma 54-interacting transcriptional regulator [Bacillota bacterium]MDH7495182.1 sigma 54-interacting transcriptional regulator [Bacillota bacterium]
MTPVMHGTIAPGGRHVHRQDWNSARLHGAERDPFSAIIGRSPGVAAARDLARRAARGGSNVLLLGETGVGKEVFARAIHDASGRASGPFVVVNCAAVPETLMESELFGYEEGAFTGALRSGKPGKFEQASGGTIFLDEIGDMPLVLQAKVLRAIQERAVERLGGTKEVPVDARLIAATNKDLRKMVSTGEFREDLYYRLDVVTITIPPLRERKEDLPELVDCFLKKLNRLCHTSVTGVHPAVMDAFLSYHWPGNLRELENVLERALNLTDGDEIRPEHIPVYFWGAVGAHFDASRGFRGQGLGESLAAQEGAIIVAALRASGNNKTKAAKMLNISRSGLYKKLKRHGISSKT